MDRYDLFIGGRWVRPHSDDRTAVENPATERPMGSVPRAEVADVDRAIAAARAAAADWRATPVRTRVRYVRALADNLRKRADDLATTITREMGAPARIARPIHTDQPIAIIESFAEVAEGFAFEEKVANSQVWHEPVGVVGAITPWNYPLHQILVKITPALLAGCTTVLKPSDIAPLSAFVLFDAIEATDLPPGVVNLVTGPGGVVGNRLATCPDVDMVSFTGSTEVGRGVATAAADGLKKVALELGGKSASVVLPDADFATAVKVSINNGLFNGGQTCTAWTRLIVPETRLAHVLEIAAATVARYKVGDPHDTSTKLGPLASRQQRDTVRDYVRGALEDGARIAVGSDVAVPDTGYFVPPTILAAVDPWSTVAQEEVFGPVICVLTYRDEVEALKIANATRYGLHGGVWSSSPDRAVEFARGLETGTVDINGGRYNPLAPFGGRKQSGLGCEMGLHGFLEYLRPKSLQI